MNSFAQLSPEDRSVYLNEAAARKGVSAVIVETLSLLWRGGGDSDTASVAIIATTTAS